MEKTALESLRFPIGRFKTQENISMETVNQCIRDIEALPGLLRMSVKQLDDKQLDTPYRPEGWTVRQVVHHLADSHVNSYIRFKWALTEDAPTIKAYDEKKWAELEDARTAPVEISLNLLEALHRRWVIMLKNLSKDDLKKTFIHPASGFVYTLEMIITLYAWHGKHHVAHIESLKERSNW
jgi:hypothetical protein